MGATRPGHRPFTSAALDSGLTLCHIARVFVARPVPFRP